MSVIMPLVRSVQLLDQYIAQQFFDGFKVGLVNLGCARNVVDAQGILQRLMQQGIPIVDPTLADIIILNTCSFIEDAKKESIDHILDLIHLKEKGKIKKILVVGCLSQRYGQELVEAFEEVDGFVGVPTFNQKSTPSQIYLTPRHYAYVRICESCYHKCSFCVIPFIKGKFSSVHKEAILEEVKQLDKNGVKEINIIGQDISSYGLDIYQKKYLAHLLKDLVKITKNIEWIRLLYNFPAHITDELLDVIHSEPKVCNYMDVPLQHISDSILQKMNRQITSSQSRDLIKKIKTKIPGVCLRTTMIVGFPSESDKDFQELMDFVGEVKFDKLGAFIYSKEEGTAACDFPDQVAKTIKSKRYKKLLGEQKKISKNRQQRFIGQELRVLVEEKIKGNNRTYLARSEFDAPEVDGLVYVQAQTPLEVGNFTKVKIKDALEYDLSGEVL